MIEVLSYLMKEARFRSGGLAAAAPMSRAVAPLSFVPVHQEPPAVRPTAAFAELPMAAPAPAWFLPLHVPIAFCFHLPGSKMAIRLF
jgi:hypothetical protein